MADNEMVTVRMPRDVAKLAQAHASVILSAYTGPTAMSERAKFWSAFVVAVDEALSAPQPA